MVTPSSAGIVTSHVGDQNSSRAIVSFRQSLPSMLKRKLLDFNPHLIMERKLLSTVLNYLLISTIGTVSAFNLDTESSVVYEGPLQSELFGYSVATHSYAGKQW